MMLSSLGAQSVQLGYALFCAVQDSVVSKTIERKQSLLNLPPLNANFMNIHSLRSQRCFFRKNFTLPFKKP